MKEICGEFDHTKMLTNMGQRSDGGGKRGEGEEEREQREEREERGKRREIKKDIESRRMPQFV